MDKMTPWNLFLNSCRKYPDQVMVIHNNREFTYDDIYNQIVNLATLIEQLNFKMGGIYLPNCAEFITWMLALNKQAKIIIPLSNRLKGNSLREVIQFADVEILVTDAKGYENVQEVLEHLELKGILIINDESKVEFVKLKSKGKKISPISQDTFGICFTSGSTSKPKGVVLSNSAITGNALVVAEYLKFENTERTIIPRSMSQASPISGDILMAISSGGGIIILNDLFHPAIFLKAIQDYQATNVFLIRTMLSLILKYPQLDNFDLRSMKRIMLGGMLNPKSIFIEAAQKLPNIKFLNAYGLSEASARVSFLGPEEVLKYPGSIGRPMRGCFMNIYKEDGVLAKPYEIGEIYVQSDYLMDCYYKAPQLTAAALSEKGLRTQDTGYSDEDGFFYVVGRNDDLIIQGGTKVYPIEIQEVLLKLPSVKEVEVIGIEDEILGKKIVVFVSLLGTEKLTVQDLYRYCQANLESSKVPKEILIIDQAPRNNIGKISKTDLKNLYQSLKTRNLNC